MSRADCAVRALEEQVLQVVRGAVQGRRLVAGADVRPDAEGGGAHGGQGLGDDAQAAGEGGLADRTDAVLALDQGLGTGDGPRLRGGAGRRRGATRRHLSAVVLLSSSVARRFALDHGDQGELAAGVDLGDLDLDLGAHADHVLDVLHALATGELADLRDVQQTVLAGEQRHERTEGRRLHDRAQVALADLRHGRVGDAVDRGAGGLGLRAVDRHRCRSCRRPRS